jgi:hypothetical protein
MPILPLCAFMACSRVTFTFTLYLKTCGNNHYTSKSPNSSAGTVTTLWTGLTSSRGLVLSTEAFISPPKRPARLEPHQPSIQFLSGFLSPRLKHAYRDANHLPVTFVEVKTEDTNTWTLHNFRLPFTCVQPPDIARHTHASSACGDVSIGAMKPRRQNVT